MTSTTYYQNYYLKHRQDALDRERRKRHGENSVEHFNSQLKLQSGCCEICYRKLSAPQQDHDPICCPRKEDHSGRNRTKCCGKCLRGLLCRFCNSRLGYVEDTLIQNPEIKIAVRNSWLQKAQNYLWKWKKIHAST